MKNDLSDTICPRHERACVAAAAKIISTKWTPQLIYALANGVSRFSGLQREVGGVNPRTLSARLDELVSAGIISKCQVTNELPYLEYALTDKGRDLVPILEQMVEWSEKHAPVTA